MSTRSVRIKAVENQIITLYLENYTLNLKLKYLINKNKFNFTDKRESIFCL